jgi:hypothetical protein
MLATALAQLRFAVALLTGRPIPSWALAGLITGAVATRQEFGPPGRDAAEAMTGPMLDALRQPYPWRGDLREQGFVTGGVGAPRR